MNAKLFQGNILILLLGVLFISSCSTTKNIKELPSVNNLSMSIDTSKALSTGFTGLIIYDLEQKKVVFQRNADKYFVPASNTKLFTLYAALKTFGDSIPALRYVETDSTFTFWGTGDPTLMHPYFALSHTIDFLKSKASTKKMFLSDGHSSLEHYGEGWMWDDYNGYYQPELSHFPMYGNVLKVKKDSIGLIIAPMTLIQKSYSSPNQRNIKRVLDDNIFIIPARLDSVKTYDQEIPYKDAARVNHKLLEEVLNTKIESLKIPVPARALTLYSLPTDTVLRRMMQVSDNMLAEHLLLLSGMISGDTLSSPYAIESIGSKYLSDLSHRPIWVDGSGLTRYNMFTPQSILDLLLKMDKEVEEKRLLSLLAYNGGNGTIRNMFNTQAKPYVFAKSGTLAGVYNLSGFMLTPSGKKLVFSFMNNNFSGGSAGVRKEVERILEQARLMY